ncbi:hypothetical protein ES754_01265 [Psychrobacter frigidicola]|uniref:Lipoprotein n=1 Tax=Psychrobacter frigidicola TaxID=45611 RepID=A0A5C7A271_9GAMM|nr:hypothetical protein [Psychrobacter frigidicola]TXD97647.1 hypothetical protein ES754_01265 [Psychrobacter frigidicola]
MMSRRTDIISKKLSILAVSITACSALFLVGCDSSDNNKSTTTADSNITATKPDLSIFEGCYTVSNDEPAQIKVSEQNGAWVMQMKEPASANRVWDTPEPLEVLDNSDISKYFSIDPDNVDAVIGRPDRVLVMAHVKPVYANIDPLLDSEYLSYIYKGANTIYRVECDEVNTDILANPHANIKIDNVRNTKEL